MYAETYRVAVPVVFHKVTSYKRVRVVPLIQTVNGVHLSIFLHFHSEHFTKSSYSPTHPHIHTPLRRLMPFKVLPGPLQEARVLCLAQEHYDT